MIRLALLNPARVVHERIRLEPNSQIVLIVERYSPTALRMVRAHVICAILEAP